MSDQFNWTVALASNATITDPFFVNSVRNYEWAVILTVILAFAMAWGIGANDVANAFATSVGAKSITLPTACAIAAVMEFGGALLLGGEVTDTVRKKVINIDIFDPNTENGAANGPEMLMIGFFIALTAATIWLITATYFSLPVSTTHSIIGALIGVGFAYRGKDAVIWISTGEGFKKLKGVVGVIISWVISPVLSAIIAVLFFLLVRTAVLRRADPFRNGLIFMPIFYGITLSIAVFFIVYKGDKRFDLEERLGTGGALGVAFGAGAVLAVLTALLVIPRAKRAAEKWEEDEREKEKGGEDAKEEEPEKKSKGITDALSKVGVHLSIEEELEDDVVRMHENVEKFDPKTERLFRWVQVFTAAVDAFAHGANDVANAIAPFSSVFQLHKSGGIITTRKKDSTAGSNLALSGGSLGGRVIVKDDEIPTGESFCGNILEGSGDDQKNVSYYRCKDKPVFPYKTVSSTPGVEFGSEFDRTLYNSSGFATEDSATCYSECNPRNYFEYKSKKQDVELWILAMGGAGIVLGLAMWGYKIILAIGVKLTKLTPSRGFAIEIGAAITVLIASDVGLPVSTTHCQVGATMGVGLVEGKRSTVNWKQFFFICAGWVFTVLFTAVLSACMYLVVTNAPSNMRVPQGTLNDSGLDFCPGNQVFIYNEEEQGFAGVLCSGQDAAEVPEL